MHPLHNYLFLKIESDMHGDLCDKYSFTNFNYRQINVIVIIIVIIIIIIIIINVFNAIDCCLHSPRTGAVPWS